MQLDFYRPKYMYILHDSCTFLAYIVSLGIHFFKPKVKSINIYIYNISKNIYMRDEGLSALRHTPVQYA